jgi:ABC-2 type transport system permease protein
MKLSNIFNRRNRILLKELVVTDFKLRYQGSALGYLWSVLKPLFLFAILYLVFDKFLKLGRGVEHYPVYLLTGVVLWSFFTEATTQGLNSIVKRGSLIRKINFPKYIIVISGTISALINLAINIGVIFVFVLLNGVHISPEALLVIPLILELYVFALALAFFLAALNTKYRDIGYLWEILLQAAFYAVPIIYPMQRVLGSGYDHLAGYILVNPVSQVVQDVRHVFITHDSVTLWQLFHDWRLAIPFVVILLFGVLGALYFRKNSNYFAEQI